MKHNETMSESLAKSPIRYFVYRNNAGEITYNGVDKGGPGIVLAENENLLVVEWPTGKHWFGRGIQPSYHPASVDVLVKDQDHDGRFTLLISWEKRRTTNRKAAHQKTKE